MAPGLRIAAVLLLSSSACVFDGAAAGSGGFGAGDESLADAGATEPEPPVEPGEPEPEPEDPAPDAGPAGEPDAGEETGGDADGGSDTCPRHDLRARRHHSPPRAEDGQLDLGKRRWLLVPAELPVTSGNAGDYCAYVDFQRGGNVTRCVYRGGADESTPKPGSSDWSDGLSYALAGCTEQLSEREPCRLDDELDLEADAPVEVDQLILHIEGGAYSNANAPAYDPTQVDARFDEDCGDGNGED